MLCLGHQAEDSDEREGIEARVEAERPDLAHRRDHGREGEAENTGKDEVDRDGPGHSLLTVHGGEHLGAVLEADGALGERVEDGEDVDEADAGQTGSSARGGITAYRATRPVLRSG